jgi:hypothetical protein
MARLDTQHSAVGAIRDNVAARDPAIGVERGQEYLDPVLSVSGIQVTSHQRLIMGPTFRLEAPFPSPASHIFDRYGLSVVDRKRVADVPGGCRRAELKDILWFHVVRRPTI